MDRDPEQRADRVLERSHPARREVLRMGGRVAHEAVDLRAERPAVAERDVDQVARDRGHADGLADRIERHDDQRVGQGVVAPGARVDPHQQDVEPLVLAGNRVLGRVGPVAQHGLRRPGRRSSGRGHRRTGRRGEGRRSGRRRRPGRRRPVGPGASSNRVSRNAWPRAASRQPRRTTLRIRSAWRLPGTIAVASSRGAGIAQTARAVTAAIDATGRNRTRASRRRPL